MEASWQCLMRDLLSVHLVVALVDPHSANIRRHWLAVTSAPEANELQITESQIKQIEISSDYQSTTVIGKQGATH